MMSLDGLTSLKYFTVVSSVLGKVFSKSRARSGSLSRAFKSVMTFWKWMIWLEVKVIASQCTIPQRSSY